MIRYGERVGVLHEWLRNAVFNSMESLQYKDRVVK